MQVLSDHFLSDVKREIIPGGSEIGNRRFIVIHFTDGALAKSSISWWRNPKAKGANAHIVIDRDGTIYQCRPFNRTCGHAGVSEWKGFKNLNSCSIGIELANGGCDEPGPDGFDWAKRQPGTKFIKAAHKNGGRVVEWEAYTESQIRSCELVLKALVETYPTIVDVVGHEDIAPSRKNDPGPVFPMQRVREFCGFKGLPSR